jgi:deferrochelatase/peroxidase EfeB
VTDQPESAAPESGPASGSVSASGSASSASETASGSSTSETSTISRRGLFATAAGGAALGALGGVVGTFAVSASAAPPGPDALNEARTYPFYTGSHQAGIHTEPQRYCVYMTFDLQTALRQDLQVLLARWSAGIAQLMQGKPVGLVEPDRPGAVPADTGEAADLGANSLTVTLGLGPGVFDERFGLKSRRPALLADLPSMPSDQLQPALTGGDLSLQACADDPQVAYHAVRDLARMARGTADTRWTVMGFGRASAGPHQSTPRNLMGFKDGTRNISTDDDYDRFVWLGEDAGWMSGGSYQVARKIQMNIETWDADRIGDQQTVFGRSKSEGAPLSGTREHDRPDFAARRGGEPVISPTAHIALAAHENNGGVKILRRSYNYTDGLNQFGKLDAGLLFLAYQNDPDHFVRLQRKLGSSDRLNEYIAHIGSAIFAVPPAPKPGHYIGEQLFT